MRLDPSDIIELKAEATAQKLLFHDKTTGYVTVQAHHLLELLEAYETQQEQTHDTAE